MSDYEIFLLTAAGLLILSLLSGFNAATNRRPVAFSLVVFVAGGFALFYASTLNPGSNFAADLPGAVFKLYATVMN